MILSEALKCVERAKSIKPSSEIESSALRLETYAALQNTLDAMSMIIADLGLSKPSAYSELGKVLHEGGVIGESFVQIVEKVAVLRNTLAHAYRRVPAESLEAIVKEFFPKVEKLIKSLSKTVMERGFDPENKRHFLDVEKLASLTEVFKKHSVLLAYLFGSRSRGSFRVDSDYDIAVLFEGENVGILREAELAIDVARKLGVPSSMVDIASLNTMDYPLIAKVLKDGVSIYWQNENQRKAWERRVYQQILQNTDLYAIYTKRALR